ncbi:MAG: hypothetical protein WAW37_05265 [Syntrophobacteraceae bacterium]
MKINEKIKIARDLHTAWAEALRTDPAVSHGIEELCALARESGRASARTGISEVCRRCDEDEGGSCCGAGIEDRYTPELILMNLLLGVEIPDARHSEKSCHFLGARGCILAARDIICINYLCARVRDEIGEQSLLLLQEATGREMEALFVLHDTIRKKIRR